MTTDMAAATAISQLSCFSAVNRSLHLRRRTFLFPSPRSKLSVVMCLERHGTDTAGSDTKNTLSYAADVSKLHVEEKKNSYSTKDEHDAEKLGIGEATQESVGESKKTAKIHDFCLGIPFEDECLHVNSHIQNIPENARHLSFAENNLFGNSFTTKWVNVRTVLFPNGTTGANGETLLNTCVPKFKYLRYLDLSESACETLPRCIDCPKLLSLLDNIHDLRALERLKIEGCPKVGRKCWPHVALAQNSTHQTGGDWRTRRTELEEEEEEEHLEE